MPDWKARAARVPGKRRDLLGAGLSFGGIKESFSVIPAEMEHDTIALNNRHPLAIL